jgi:hypothetical protein
MDVLHAQRPRLLMERIDVLGAQEEPLASCASISANATCAGFGLAASAFRRRIE